MHKKLGSGKYSFVFEGFDLLQKKEVVLKILKHSDIEKINREIMTLNLVKGLHPSLANLIDYGIDRLNGTVILVSS